MLTRQQLQRLAQREHIGLQAQERDYVQHLLVALLSFRSEALIFKGGTALRMVYKGNRYSEDLDFDGPNDVAWLRETWAGVAQELNRYGLVADIRQEWQGEVGYSLDVSYQGPLYDGRDRTKGKVRVDISLRQEQVITRRELVTPVYDDIRPFVVKVLAPEHVMAEKMRALLVRAKPRDLYDLWLMHSQGWRLDPVILAQKLEPYGRPFTVEWLNERLAHIAPDWERDMRPLLSQFITYDEAKQVIGALIEGK
jgi:predicted nucleotidyltransferase component of viral defense system